MTAILTLQLDPASRHLFEHLRQLHFPPSRNLIPAHLTLFHALPDAPGIQSTLELLAAAQTSFPLTVTGLRSLGKGVAYTLASPALLALHSQLAEAFQQYLIPQDKQKFMPHIVIQNKVSPDAARALLAELQQSFQPREAQACGLDLWEYLGGPWRLLRTFPFKAAPTPR